MKRLAADLTARFGRGFGVSNLKQIKAFYLAYVGTAASADKGQTASGLLTRGNARQRIQELHKGKTS